MIIWKWNRSVFGNNGISWIPGLVIVNGKLPEKELRRVINNELVHQKQWLECFIVGFPFVYLWYWFRLRFIDRVGKLNAYLMNPMEIDSRTWDEDLNNRPAYWWMNVA